MKIEEFVFLKKDGSVRTIVGTRDFDNVKKIDPKYEPPKGVRKSADHVTVIWDLEAHTFKSFVTENLVSRREIGFTPIDHKLFDFDFYHKEAATLRRNKTPHLVLSIIATFQKRSKEQLIASLNFLSEKLNISKNQKRNVRRILRAFENNNIIESDGQTYHLTETGREFLKNNVSSFKM